MVVDERHADQLTPQQALHQIGYLRDLVQETRISVAAAWPSFVLWGIVWIIGYSATALSRSDVSFAPSETILAAIWITPLVVASVLSALTGRAGRRGAPTTTLGRRLFRLNVGLAVFGFAVLPFVLFGSLDVTISFDAYIPLWIGVLYVVNGLFVGDELTAIGAWILGAAVISHFLDPSWVRPLWLAVAGGGGLLITGLIFRRDTSKAHVA